MAAALWMGLAALAVGSCGGRHTTTEDGGTDGAADTGGDADQGGGDADRGDADGVGADGDVEVDWDPADTTWLIARSPSSYGFYALEPVPGGGVLVLGDLLSVARLEPSGRLVWWRSFGRYGADVSIGADGTVFATGSQVLLGMDLHGRLLSHHRIEPTPFRLHALDDGSVVLATSGIQVTRLSPADGVMWRSRVRSLGPADRVFGLGLAVTDEGTIFIAEPGQGTAPRDHRLGTVLHAMSLEGELLWSALLQGGLVRSIAATEDGGVVVVGRADGMWVCRLDRDGGLEWSITVGSFVEGYVDDEPPCHPYCDVEEAQDVAVGAGGEVMAVGYSSARLPWTMHIDPMVLWLDREGAVLRSILLFDPSSPEGSGSAQAAAALPGGGWLVGGSSSGAGLLASLDADGSLGGPCEHVYELDFEPRATPYFSVEPLEVTVDEGTFELVDADPLEPEDETPVLRRLCD